MSEPQHLIAAAPEMLEALKETVDALADAYNLAKLEGLQSEVVLYDKAFNAGMRAIAKAEGRTL